MFETICRNEGITRAQLVAETKMSEMTVGRSVDFLLKSDLVLDRLNDSNNDVGRPASRLYLSRNFVNIGVSLESGGVSIGLVDSYGGVLQCHRHRFQTEGMAPEEVLGIAAEQIEEFVREHAPEGAQAIGMAIPGLIDYRNGYVRLSSQLNWADVPAAEILRKNPFIPDVIIENDVKARALGENRFGSRKESKSSVLLNIGNGVGAGVVVEGEIYRGKKNYAGEIGHTMLSANNRICRCGRKGCIEATISQPAVLREARIVDPDIDIAGIEAAYRKGEVWTATLLNIVAEYILTVVNILANTYAPDVIVLCGSLVEQCEALRDIIMEQYRKQYPSIFNDLFSLEFSEFGTNGDLIGAAAIAFDHNIMQHIANPMFLK